MTKAPSIHFVRRPAESRFSRARELALEIEQLLATATPDELENAGYGVRIAEGITRSLIDQLEELHRGPSSSRRLPIGEVAAATATRRTTGVA
jgi:hypothetical protein